MGESGDLEFELDMDDLPDIQNGIDTDPSDIFTGLDQIDLSPVGVEEEDVSQLDTPVTEDMGEEPELSSSGDELDAIKNLVNDNDSSDVL